MEENWLPCPGFEDHYSISDHGRLRRDTPTLAWRAGKIHRPYINPSTGYIQCCITVDGLEYHRLSHRLVAMAFLGPPPAGRPHVNHKDGDRTNNHVSNLEWCSPIENIRHSIDVLGRDMSAHWLKYAKRGDDHYKAKLCTADLEAIKGDRQAGMKLQEIADKYQVSRMTICRVLANTARAAQKFGGEVRSLPVRKVRVQQLTSQA